MSLPTALVNAIHAADAKAYRRELDTWATTHQKKATRFARCGVYGYVAHMASPTLASVGMFVPSEPGDTLNVLLQGARLRACLSTALHAVETFRGVIWESTAASARELSELGVRTLADVPPDFAERAAAAAAKVADWDAEDQAFLAAKGMAFLLPPPGEVCPASSSSEQVLVESPAPPPAAETASSAGKRKLVEPSASSPPAKKSRALDGSAVAAGGPRSSTKNVDSGFFQLEDPPVPEVDVHDLLEFLKARLNWLGASDIAKLFNSLFENPHEALRILAGLLPPREIDARGRRNMQMGHDNEPVAIDLFKKAFAAELIGSRFYAIPGTALVVTPDDVVVGAGPRLAHLLGGEFPEQQPVEVKSHVSGNRLPYEKERWNGQKYNVHSKTFVQMYLQSLSICGGPDGLAGKTPAGFLLDYDVDGTNLRVWHVTFPNPRFGEIVLERAEAARKALLLLHERGRAAVPEAQALLPELAVPYELVVCTEVTVPPRQA